MTVTSVPLEQSAIHQRRIFFSEEKKQKTFIILGTRQPRHVRQESKVFWFFFSKKNILPSASCP
jgi:hypothetical protein